MKDGQFEVGDVVQVKPEPIQQPWLRGVFVIVTEPKPFGLQGYIPYHSGPKDKEPGEAYIRLNFSDVEYIGKAGWYKQ